MKNPLTQLDERFSDADTQPTTWAATREVLEKAQLSWLTTVRADGRPHVTPLVAVWLDEALHFATGETEQKFVNLTNNPNVVLTTGCNSWDHGLDVIVEGQASRVTDRATLERLATAWRTKWEGCWQTDATDSGFEHPGGPAAVFAVKPNKILAFGRQRLPTPDRTTMLALVAFTHTRHLPAVR